MTLEPPPALLAAASALPWGWPQEVPSVPAFVHQFDTPTLWLFNIAMENHNF